MNVWAKDRQFGRRFCRLRLETMPINQQEIKLKVQNSECYENFLRDQILFIYVKPFLWVYQIHNLAR